MKDTIEQTSPTMEPYLDKAEIARRLGKSKRTVDDWMRRGLLPHYKLGRSVVFRWSDIQRHFDTHYRVSFSPLDDSPIGDS